MRDLTIEEVRNMREATGYGMMTCKEIITKQIITEAIHAEENVYEILTAIMKLI